MREDLHPTPHAPSAQDFTFDDGVKVNAVKAAVSREHIMCVSQLRRVNKHGRILGPVASTHIKQGLVCIAKNRAPSYHSTARERRTAAVLRAMMSSLYGGYTGYDDRDGY